MSDDRRLTTDRFYGGTSNRLDILKRFLSFLNENPVSRSEAQDWLLSNTQARSRDSINHHLGFLNATELIDVTDDTVSLGNWGRRYLSSPEPPVLYESLRSNVKGFDTIIHRMQDGPLTDEDIKDLLVSEFADINMGTPQVAARHREWLQVLGYVERSDGANRLTADGHQLAESLDGDTPLSEIIESDVSVPRTDSEDTVGLDDIELPDGSETTERRPTTRDDVVRNEELVRKLKALYDDTCQICGDRRRKGPDNGFSHVHHLMPLGEPHNGPDVPENVLVVCPNHHEDFENGMLSIDPQTLEVDHFYEDSVTGRKVDTKNSHEIGPQYVAYHNQVIALNED
ncbi:HNH endonuclease [Haloferax profundi]|uniref:HNH nuclease domain-containing protein n=1 Tax=Haloferax profundi TaxID=1544718 RepID=A0A0W1SW09_9EURY|nr:HNH endonuclease [Haloferax profundi]KTG30651.1 hypothetical protein AUR66_06870 [Haloferax profundi]